VTNEAVAKSRKAAARAARTHRRVYVTGCGANLQGDAFASLPPNVTVVAKRSEETAAFVAGDVGAIGCVQADARIDRVRAFVKIQDGCSFSCNFCVIPLVRGASRSRSADAVLSEIRRRAEQGHREVVLTGINLGCFRDRDAGYDLPRLVREAGRTPGLERLRLSSIEINHVNDALVAALRETPAVSKHLHVPLQSGDDAVLSAMGRHYDAEEFLFYMAALRAAVSHVNVTTDVIVGFPTEDQPAFERTLGLIDAAGITRVHVFPYSPRPGTAAAALGDRVPPEEKKRRSRELRGRAEVRSRHHRATKLGRRELVLVDKVADTQCSGYTGDYTRCYLPAGAAARGELVGVVCEELHADGLRCSVSGAPTG
jgi:threonylcarbamoyladenosine tRNA methylthiotransferase MtaB